MFTELQPVFDGANAMLVERGRLLGAARQVIVRFLFRLERSTFQKGDLLIENAGVPDTRDVATGYVRQPQIVVGNAGAHSAARRWMPPMLHIAFAELIRGRAQKMLARQARCGMHERHHVLQLVSKSECSTGLIKPG